MLLQPVPALTPRLITILSKKHFSFDAFCAPAVAMAIRKANKNNNFFIVKNILVCAFYFNTYNTPYCDIVFSKLTLTAKKIHNIFSY